MEYNCDKVDRKIHPRDKANYFSLFTFSYVLGIYKKGYKKNYEEKTLPKVIKQLKSHTCGNDIELQWKRENRRHIKPSILRVLLRRYCWRYGFIGLIFLTWKFLRIFLEPPAMMKLVEYFREGQTQFTRNDAIRNGAFVLFLNLMDSVLLRNILLYSQEICIEIRTGLTSLIYRKVLRLRVDALNKISVGNIVTLITKDIDIVEDSINYLHVIYVGMVQICLLCYMLYNKLGMPSIGGILFVKFLVSTQVYLGKIISKLRVKVDKLCDERLQTTKQALSSIKLIKIYVWENYFYSNISKLRRNEMKTMLKEVFLRFLLKVIGSLCISLSVYILIMSQAWFDYSITTEIVFFILSCFRQVNIMLTRILPGGIGKFAEFFAGCSRLENLFHAEEIQIYNDQVVIKPEILLKNVSVHFWGKTVLENISFQVESGLVCITGSISSGKSSLLKTILREYPISSGTLNTLGRISYAAQEPWIFPSTVRQNIIFGNSYDIMRYQNVLKVCALEFDLKLFKFGDETILLENGANLSKGQQARINLARALYRDAEIYLLDDCLSSLDAKVNQFIFQQAIRDYLKDKICLFVTQDSNHIQNADQIIVLENHKITFSGKSSIEPTIPGYPENVVYTQDMADEEDNHCMEYSEHDKLICKTDTAYFENIVQGKLKMQYYYKYLKFGRGYLVFTIIVVLYFVNQVSQSFSTKLLAQWADRENTLYLLKNASNVSTYNEALNSKKQTIIMYSLSIFFTILLSLIKTYAFFDYARVSSIRVHDIILKNVLNAEMHFFDTHLIGNILNRFSNDMNNIDELLPYTANEFLNELVSTFGILLLISLVNWKFAIPVILCLIVIYLLKIFCLHVVLNLKRLSSSTRSPMVGQINATLDDLITVRASRCQNILVQEFDKNLDQFTCVHYTAYLCVQALSFFIDLTSVVLMCSFVVFFLVNKQGVTSGDVGLVLVQVFSLNGHLQYALRMWATMQSDVTSIERILEYASTKQEEKTGTSLKDWPKLGTINYSNVSLTYPTSDKTILKNINSNIDSHEKIGIIGRTGSGKSTFISALFRLYEFEGNILIDGTDIKNLNLNTLRENIDLLPQNSFLFNGTVRSNLDPLNQYDDDKIRSVISELNIKSFIPGIDMLVQNNGSNFTHVQKQLLCLARVLIRNKNIIIVDEVTSNMDKDTEMFTLNVMKKYFSEKTVLIIAHRLNTILDYDKLLVLQSGEIIESGNVSDLLQMEDGYLAGLVKKIN